MSQAKYKFICKWADLDPNGHMRHTAYNDYCAQARIMYFEELQISFGQLLKMGIGPVLFREEMKYFKEIHLNETFSVGFSVLRLRKDCSKWSFLHKIYNQKEELSASVEVDGAWLDLQIRKTCPPPQELVDLFVEKSIKSKDFVWLPDKQK